MQYSSFLTSRLSAEARQADCTENVRLRRLVCHVYTNAWVHRPVTAWGGGCTTQARMDASHLGTITHLRWTNRSLLNCFPILKEAAQFFLESMVEHPESDIS